MSILFSSGSIFVCFFKSDGFAQRAVVSVLRCWCRPFPMERSMSDSSVRVVRMRREDCADNPFYHQGKIDFLGRGFPPVPSRGAEIVLFY